MPKPKRKATAKDSATKNTFNPPGPAGQRGPQLQQPETVGRQVGQYTGSGVPSLQKK